MWCWHISLVIAVSVTAVTTAEGLQNSCKNYSYAEPANSQGLHLEREGDTLDPGLCTRTTPPPTPQKKKMKNYKA